MEAIAPADLSVLLDAPVRRSGLKRKATAPLKRVEFSIATEYTFRVGYGATSVPHDSIPAVGLEGPAIHVETKSIQDKQSQLMMYTPRDRVCLLRRAGYTVEDLHQQSRDLQAIQISRSQTVEEYIKERQQNMVKETRERMQVARLLS
ncbi:unnamed protein product [Aphanomyces euteiches]|uniref:Uncharacterized protein n=1 Tax=Aphanomyces euteiches TaxID=100861 RepID=A0A6G0XW39_9STRA|nr:hypothetical protein Ae201684_001191 [Aphanomyces euteiches]KAH9099979.1 hypothetical protein Ae201684P_018985 [Aphanomyces euteiches]KAH9152080.1 hypothetical protein AeRB84_005438 [Aphanomyces euteiches]